MGNTAQYMRMLSQTIRCRLSMKILLVHCLENASPHRRALLFRSLANCTAVCVQSFMNASIPNAAFAITSALACKFSKLVAASMYVWVRSCLSTPLLTLARSSRSFSGGQKDYERCCGRRAINNEKSRIFRPSETLLESHTLLDCPKKDGTVTGLPFSKLYGSMIVSMRLAIFAVRAAIIPLYLRERSCRR